MGGAKMKTVRDGDWFEEIRQQIFGAASPCTVGLHQARTMWREIANLREDLADAERIAGQATAQCGRAEAEVERLEQENERLLRLNAAVATENGRLRTALNNAAGTGLIMYHVAKNHRGRARDCQELGCGLQRDTMEGFVGGPIPWSD